MEQVAGSSKPAPGPNALPFGTPGATPQHPIAQALRFASPKVPAAVLPGAEGGKRRKLKDKTTRRT
jgi:hypothetical protein